MSNIIPSFFIGGLGCDDRYFYKINNFFIKNQEVVFFIPLIHNLESNSVEVQIDNIKSIINKNIGNESKFNLISYSMGYIATLKYYEKYPSRVNKVILISSASIFPKLNSESLHYLIKDTTKYEHIIPIKNTSPDFVNSDFLSVICKYNYVFNLVFLLSSRNTYLRALFIKLYTYLYSSRLIDPEPKNVGEFLFSNTLENILDLITSNLIEQNMFRVFNDLQNKKKIDIITGEKDYYTNYSSILSNRYPNIILHRVPYGHHALHFEIEHVGNKIINILYS